jgi:voltage-gated potassium channel
MKIHLLNKIVQNKTFRHFLLKLFKNLAFRIFLIGFVTMFCFSYTAYYVESHNIVYNTVDGQSVEDSGQSSNIRSLWDSIWWAFVTSSTVGYGDFYPKTVVGRVMGILLMFFGMTLFGIITGNIASVLVEKQMKEGRGLNELSLKNHFIICGWKREMGKFLHDVMDKNKTFLSTDIVLINTADPQLIEKLRLDSAFTHINFISGDYIDELILARANLKNAARVLVIADEMVQGSLQEIDSRTVMAIITIKSISKSVYTCAELLDSKFERYLRFSSCDEVVLSREYSRSMIANASAGSGISHVISELLNVNAAVSINTFDIPDEFIGKNFNELFFHVMKKDSSILIGILENTGNFYTRKKHALQDAQKTPDISKLVDNLKFVKSLVANKPVINPEPSYEIKKFSKAIIIEGRTRLN